MTEYYIEKFYGEYALKKEDTIIAVIDTGTNARKVCDLLNEQDNRIQELEKENEQLKSILQYTISRLETEVKPKDTLYGVTIVVNGEMYRKIKKILEGE